MSIYQVYNFTPPDHVVTVEEAPTYWQTNLFDPLDALAATMPDDLVVQDRQLVFGVATVDATDRAYEELMAMNYTLVPVKPAG